MKNTSYIKGLIAKKAYEDDSTMLRCHGPVEAMEKLKEKLTLVNKSVGFQIRMSKQRVEEYSRRQDQYAKEQLPKELEKLKNLQDELFQEYWVEKDGDLIVPAGFWFLMEKITDDSHLNTVIKPYNVDGQRDYQKEMLAEMLKYKRSTGVLATGLGKTRCVISLAMSALSAGYRPIIIAPTKDLVDQFISDTKPFHESVTGVYSGKYPKQGADILVSTVGVAKRYIDSYDVVIIDESHHSVANSWANLLGSCKHAEYVYNFTATPFRSDGLDLGISAFGGPVVFERDVVWGIQNDYLEHFDVYLVRIPALDKDGNKIIVPGDKNNMIAFSHLCSNDHFISKVAKLIERPYKEGRKIIYLSKTLKSANLLKKATRSTINFRVADANFKKPLRDFQNGDTDILVATAKLVGEGINIPDADFLIINLQNSSDGMTLQVLGRVLRKSKVKRKPIVIDIIATGYSGYDAAARNRAKVWSKAADKVLTLTL